MTSRISLGYFECRNPECDFIKNFEFHSIRERRKCPRCQESMVQVPKETKEEKGKIETNYKSV